MRCMSMLWDFVFITKSLCVTQYTPSERQLPATWRSWWRSLVQSGLRTLSYPKCWEWPTTPTTCIVWPRSSASMCVLANTITHWLIFSYCSNCPKVLAPLTGSCICASVLCRLFKVSRSSFSFSLSVTHWFVPSPQPSAQWLTPLQDVTSTAGLRKH